MDFINWIQSKATKMKWYDVSLVKLATFFFTLFLITVWQGFRDFVLGYAWYWYLILGIILALIPFKRMFLD